MITGNGAQDRFLSFLYGCVPGRIAVKILVNPFFSRIGGAYLSSPLSRWLIKPFVKRNGIDLTQYKEERYGSYNDFFVRSLKDGERLIDEDPAHLISPCDAKLSVYPVTRAGRFRIKHTDYTLEELLKSKKLAKEYEGGLVCVFRLTVDDYHHYCYVDEGQKSRNFVIPGVLHTVNPVANDVTPIYKENSRQFGLLKSANFGTILMMEVGALMVGKITNLHERAQVSRGEEKGYFEFGGSTVILVLQPGRVRIDEDIRENSRQNIETIVKQGEKIGEKDWTDAWEDENGKESDLYEMRHEL